MSSMNCCFGSDLFSGLFNRCDQNCCCSCCVSPFRPRYRRLVDNIFPPNAADGLNKSNMEKLVFYSLSSPEKLDRIGDYLAEKISRDLYRHRFGFVVIAFEAMDQLLVACHSLNPFVNSYLRVLQSVLECSDAELQLLATKSFVKYANIEEDVPSYHRAYDFFISKFASLCHDNNDDLKKRKKLRTAGLTGIKGLIRKSKSEQIQMDIWKVENMDKIVPSLLFNMHSADFNRLSSSAHSTPSMERRSSLCSLSSPPVLAEDCLRELVQRATYGQVPLILNPLIKHLDLHKLWHEAGGSEKFAISSFRIVMYSIQSQLSYNVLQILVKHLNSVREEELLAGSPSCQVDSTGNGNGSNYTSDRMRRSLPNEAPRQKTELISVRTGIVDVLREIITSAVTDSFNLSILDLLTSLMTHLKQSNENICAKQYTEEEKHFQDSVVNTLGAFAINLPDFQKLEIMIFLIDKAPPPTSTEESDIQLQKIIMNGILKVAAEYQVKNLMQIFPSSLLNQLLSRALSPDSGVRVKVHKIFHQLLDRHSNLEKLLFPCTLTPLEKVSIEKAERSDLSFIKRYSHDILMNIYQTIELSNNEVANFNCIYTTLALICIEMNTEEVLIDLLRLTFAIQELATHSSTTLDDEHRARIHGLAAGFLHLFSDLKAIPAICSHVESVIQKRQEVAPRLLPEFSGSADTGSCSDQLDSACRSAEVVRSNSNSRQGSLENLTASGGGNELLFSRNVIAEALATTGHDTSALSTPFLSRSDVDSAIPRNISDLNAITIEIDSDNSSPGTNRKTLEQEITFKEFKEILMSDYARDDITAKRKEVVNRFTQSKFEDLVDSYQRMNVNLQEKMLEVIDKLLPKGPEIDFGMDGPINGVCLQSKILNNMANRGGLYIDF